MRPAPSIATTASSAAWRTARMGARPVVVSALGTRAIIGARSVPGPCRLGVEVQDELDRGVGGAVVEGLAERRALEGDAQDRRPEPARLRGGLGANLPPARGEALGHRALPLGVKARKGVAGERRELGAAANEHGRLDEVEEGRRPERGAHARADVAARGAGAARGPLDLPGGLQHRPARGLDEQRLLAAEVVRHLAGEGAGLAGDLRAGDARHPVLGEQPRRRVEEGTARLAPGLAGGPGVRGGVVHGRDCTSYKQTSARAASPSPEVRFSAGTRRPPRWPASPASATLLAASTNRPRAPCPPPAPSATPRSRAPPSRTTRP